MKFVPILALALLAPLSAHAEGAIAVNRDGRTGISYNYRGPNAADERALSECGRSSCRIVHRFARACGAIATGRGGGYGYASRPRRNQAEGAAIENCEAQGNRGCSIETSGCDDR